MNERAQLIKTAIALELSQSGKTLTDLENALNAGDINKSASALFDVSKFPDMIKGIANLLGGGAVAGGLLGGTGAYGAYLMNEDSTNKQLKKLRERQQYLDATNNLKSDMQNPITL
jgi:hypothetical protein